MDYYGHFNRDGVNFPLNTFCLGIDESTTGQGVATVVRQWIKSMPSSRWANWLVSQNTDSCSLGFQSITCSFVARCIPEGVLRLAACVGVSVCVDR